MDKRKYFDPDMEIMPFDQLEDPFDISGGGKDN